jgi:hypothetical protein
MTTYVLVGGAWLGGWCWQTVARRLRDEGHDAYPVTLTGLGERVHIGGSWSYPRGTGPCSQGPGISLSCSSISHQISPSRMKLVRPRGTLSEAHETGYEV